MFRITDEAIQVRMAALDAALRVVESLPENQVVVVNQINDAKAALAASRDVGATHAAFRDVRFALDLAAVENPSLVHQLREARNFY